MEIRWYYNTLHRSWRMLAAGLLVPAAVAFVVTLLLPRIYEAQSYVALYKNKTEITLDSRYQTLSEDDLVRLSNQDSRRQALIALALSPHVLSETLAALPDEWAGRWSYQELADAAAVNPAGNVLQLSVRAGNPDMAAAVSNTWAGVFTRVANDAFRAPATSAELDLQARNAYTEYLSAQAAFTAFQVDNQIDELSLAIARAERAARDLQDAHQATAAGALHNALATRQRIAQVLGYAQALRDELALTPGTTPVDPAVQLAPLFLQAAALGDLSGGATTPGSGIQVAMPAAPVTAAEARDAIDRLIAALAAYERSLDESTAAQSRDVLTLPGLDANSQSALASLQTDLGDLRGQLASERAREAEVTNTRDLAWDKYCSLTRKAAELSIEALAQDTEVVVATPAVALDKPVAPQPVLNMAIAAALGLLLALGYAFARAQLEAPPPPPAAGL